MYLRQNKNKGPGAARQRIIDWCKDHRIEYVTFLDSDDMLMPHALSVLMWEANHNLADVVSTPITVETNDTHHLIELTECNTWTHGKLYRVNYLVNNNIRFPEELRTNEDLCFNLIIKQTTEKYFAVNTSVYLWRNNKFSLTRSDNEFSNDIRGADYIKAIYHYFKYCIKYNINIEKVPSLLIQSYKYYQYMLIKNNDITLIKDLLTTMFNNSLVKPLFNRSILYKTPPIPTYIIENKKVYFMPQSISEWFEDLGLNIGEYFK